MISNKLKQNKNLTAVFKKIIIPILILTIIAGIFVPTQYSSAIVGDVITAAVITPINVQLNVGSRILQTATSYVAKIFDDIVRLPLFLPPQVQQSWKMVRDFVNMFFILVLIAMAFGTIFDIERYSWRGGLLWSFLVAALFINFSFVIGEYIFNLSDNLVQIFLKMNGGKSLSVTLGQGMSFGKLATGPDMTTAVVVNFFANLRRDPVPALISQVFNIVFLAIALFSLTTATIFAIVRIPFIWFLLIISPFAWLGSALPNFRKQSWDEWWRQFIGWNFFLPVYILVLSFATVFINAKDNITGYITRVSGQPASTSGIVGLYTGDVFFYVMSVMFLVGGLAISKKASFLVGTQALNWFGKVENGVSKTLKGAGRYGLRISGSKAVYEGAKEGLKAKGAELKEKGVPVGFGQRWFGEREARLRQAKVAEFFGAREAGQKEFLSSANKEYENVKHQYEIGRININGIRNGVSRYGANSAEGYAYRKMLGEVGQLDDRIVSDTINSLANNPSAAVDFIRNSSSKGKLSAVSPRAIREMAAAEGSYTNLRSNRPARVELYKHIQGNHRVASSLTQPQFTEGIRILGGRTTTEGTEFIKEMGKVRPDYVATYNSTHAPGYVPKQTRAEIMASLLTNAKDIGALHPQVWNDLDFQQALYDEINSRTDRAKVNFITNLQESIRESTVPTNIKADKQTVVSAFTAHDAVRPTAVRPVRLPP